MIDWFGPNLSQSWVIFSILSLWQKFHQFLVRIIDSHWVDPLSLWRFNSTSKWSISRDKIIKFLQGIQNMNILQVNHKNINYILHHMSVDIFFPIDSLMRKFSYAWKKHSEIIFGSKDIFKVFDLRCLSKIDYSRINITNLVWIILLPSHPKFNCCLTCYCQKPKGWS